MSTRNRIIKKKYSFLRSWERIKEVTRIENLNQLAEIVETSNSNITKRKKEDNFPVEWAFEIAQRYGLSTEWILTGKAENQSHIKKVKTNRIEILEEIEEWLIEKVEEDPEREDWFKVELKKAFPEFKKWKEEKEESEAQKDTPTCRKVA